MVPNVRVLQGKLILNPQFQKVRTRGFLSHSAMLVACGSKMYVKGANRMQ